ncbi:MAG: 23S rRNA (guanosine(2251)-2'-O)-methyltransferase RlmB [Campylobacteraceae bacterium]|jgi:23S rRNA (guanosine2251-2'-O)-methyltransferase|nr:23S rRNA (guanosine(2251)-2'-O)-methyltransferase RlmB [Campylobacteraceae bacterium]
MLIYGKQLFLYLLSRYPKRIQNVYLAKECDKKLFSSIAKLGVKIERVDEKRAQAMAKGGNHQGFLADILPFELVPLSSLKEANFLVMLFGVTDMGNIGAIIRSAYAFGVDGIIAANLKDLKLEQILRASSAAALEMPIALAPNAYDALNELKLEKFNIYAADMSGESVVDAKLDGKKLLILGSEGYGIPNRLLERCDKKICIKTAREFDSLNVSAAAAVLFDRICNGKGKK